ncbi:hypothetical protein KP509_13G050000 [Ceratopteris richardii]|uniref:Tyrosinase copper-binding domain-containing protein n=1 Tax=Ceratopteris richardii TaxID=49495 RepID=A0A8T2TDG2_CERRI|nr:hypothetical protein KP509_13G050000 [Ceratopteris richardii]KAH7421298.1 hypothetical protein KP509_13G050000 [Ceratopteris richardii]
MRLDVAVFLAILSSAAIAYGAPMRPPYLRNCNRSVSPISLCCMLAPTAQPIQYSVNSYFRVPKIRRPARLATQYQVARLKRAYALMRALPDDDPRSLTSQKNTHCAMCLGSYLQPGTNVIYHIHYSWLFLPWHRWFIYFHERILAKLLDDPTFSLLYWDWDNQIGGNSMPYFFADVDSPLYDPYRDPRHVPPARVQLNGNFDLTDTDEIIQQNFQQLYNDIVAPTSAAKFMGGPIRYGEFYGGVEAQSRILGGTFDNGIHSNVHLWVGAPNRIKMRDMGSFDASANDPIFYAHHANVDRVWEIWRFSLPGGTREVFDDDDFLDSSFYFYDEEARLVEVTIRDCLDNTKLGIYYSRYAGYALWTNYTPPSL